MISAEYFVAIPLHFNKESCEVTLAALFIKKPVIYYFLRQIKGPHQEDRHLGAGD